MAVKEITGKEFDRILKETDENVVVVLDLWAEWCHPCKRIEPYLFEMAEKYPDRVLVLRLNVDDYPEIPSRYGVLSIPTILFFKGGEEKARIVGAKSRKDYVRKIEELLK